MRGKLSANGLKVTRSCIVLLLQIVTIPFHGGINQLLSIISLSRMLFSVEWSGDMKSFKADLFNLKHAF